MPLKVGLSWAITLKPTKNWNKSPRPSAPKQGIADGFLAPYKVIRIDLDKDIEGWRPRPGQRDKYGALIDDRIYNALDMDRNLVLDERTKLVAWKITEYLKRIGRYSKTIVFCEDIEHAERMRQALILWNGDEVVKNHKYIMRITGDDNVGKAQLDNFILPESTYPVIATTSRLMNTGVDARTCKLIVLDQTIQSMTTFKQIIGRGTRIQEEYNKTWFTIMDFKRATALFADSKFDGEPVQIYEPKPDEPPEPPVTPEPPLPPGPPRDKFHVPNVPVKVMRETVQFVGGDGTLVTESVKDYTRKTVRKKFALFDDFLNTWSKANQKRVIISELEQQGLATMGARTLLDMAMINSVGDVGGFGKKAQVLEAKGLVGKQQREFLEAALDAGNAAAHRGHCPTADQLNHVMDIVESILHQIFVLPNAAKELKKSTPPRRKPAT